MRYVDAGYVVALSMLSAYAVGLQLRRRRLERAAVATVDGGAPGASRPGVPPAGVPTAAPARPTGPEAR